MDTQRMILYVAGTVMGFACILRLHHLIQHIPAVLGTTALVVAVFWYLGKIKVLDWSKFTSNESD